MTADLQLAKVAGAIADSARARMLCALLDGRARTATELSISAEVSCSTTSAHLAKLTELGFLSVVRQGKHRYFQLANTQVATALEALLQLSATPTASFSPNTPTHLRYARSCYDHLAGTVAVALHDQLLKQGWLVSAADEPQTGTRHYQLSSTGAQLFIKLGVELQPKPRSRRQYACACLDWSERKAHLGGYLGAALLEMMLAQQWLLREPDDRVLHLTTKGQIALKQHFAMSLPERD
jgi:DNA-binding transcriptional ArsR family regulator